MRNSFVWNRKRKPKDSDVFLREKPIELLLCLTRNNSENYPSMLAKDSRCTYSHTVHLLQKMEKMDLVRFEKKGRLKLVYLTNKGSKVADLFDNVNKTLE